MDTKIIILFVGLILLDPNLARAQYKVFYIPYEVETFVPVDEEKIEKQAHFVLKYTDAIIDQAFEKIKASPEKEQSSSVNLRVKIMRLKDKESIYLNKPLGLLSSKMSSSEDKVLADRLRQSIAEKANKACKKPKAKFVIKTKNCNLVTK